MKLAAAAPAVSVPPPASAPGWIDVKVASRRSGWDEGYVRRRCCDAARCPGGTWQQLGLARQERPAGGGKPRWLVHESADPRLAPVKTVEQLSQGFDLRALPADQQTLVLKRHAAVGAMDRVVGEAVAGGRDRETAIAELVVALRKDGLAVSRRTLFRWRSDYRMSGLAGLVDERSTAPRTPDRTPDDDPFLAEVKRLYLDQHSRTMQFCYDRALDEALASGWAVCSYKTAARFLKRIPRRTAAFYRGGEEAYAAAAACVTRDYASIDANDLWVSDHHRLDVICVGPGGKLLRPWLTPWMDVRSRKIVGWKLYAHDPNADVILSAFVAAVEGHGAPFNVLMDNGKDYKSFCLHGLTARQRRDKDLAAKLKESGVFGRLGIDVTLALPYRPQSKGMIERFFGTVADRFAKQFDTYCGRDTTTKPEDLPRQLAGGKAPTIDEVAASFADWLLVDHNGKEGHRGDAMDGRAPDQVYAAELTRKRVLPAELLHELTLERTRPVKVRRNGVTWQRLSYGRDDPNLLKIEGQKVVLGIDHSQPQTVRVYAAGDGRWICNASANEKLPHLADKQLVRDAVAEERRDRKVAKQYHQVRPRLSEGLPDKLYRLAEQRRAAKGGPAPGNDPPPSLVPVRSPLEQQLPEIRRTAVPLRPAVGSESEPLPARFLYTPAARDDDDEPACGPSFRELMANRPPAQESL